MRYFDLCIMKGACTTLWTLLLYIHVYLKLSSVNLAVFFFDNAQKIFLFLYLRNRHQGISNTQLEKLIRRRGSDYEALIHYHKMQKEFERKVQTALSNIGADVKVVNRFVFFI